MLWLKLGGEYDSARCCPQKQPTSIKNWTFDLLESKYGIYEGGKATKQTISSQGCKTKENKLVKRGNCLEADGEDTIGNINAENGYDDDKPTTIEIDSSKYPF